MKALFTKNDSALSGLIRSAYGEPCSHFAWEFEQLGIVLHSNLLGVHMESSARFKRKNQIVFEKHVSTSLAKELEVLNEMIGAIDGENYDFAGLAYQTWRCILLKCFNRPIPKVNAWTNRSGFLCTRLYDAAPDDIVPILPAIEDYAMVRPFQLAQAWGVAP